MHESGHVCATDVMPWQQPGGGGDPHKGCLLTWMYAVHRVVFRILQQLQQLQRLPDMFA